MIDLIQLFLSISFLNMAMGSRQLTVQYTNIGVRYELGCMQILLLSPITSMLFACTLSILVLKLCSDTVTNQ